MARAYARRKQYEARLVAIELASILVGPTAKSRQRSAPKPRKTPGKTPRTQPSQQPDSRGTMRLSAGQALRMLGITPP